ncbi:Peroxisomal membrane protein pmp22 [Mactra antiquata]
MPNVLGIAGVGVTGVALLFSILACALPLWTISDLPCDGCTEIGLWRYCITSLGVETCDDVDEDLVGSDTFDDVKVIRAMLLLGIILTVPAIVCGLLVLFVLKDKKILFFVAGGIAILAGLFKMVGFAHYTEEIYDSDNDTTSLGAAYALCIVAWLLAWIAGALFIVAKIMDKE